MDPLAAALCGLGAAVILGTPSASVPSLLLFAAFYGVHRAIRTNVSKVLIGAPALVWIFGHLWSFVPEAILRAIPQESPFLSKAPDNLSATVLAVALVVMVAAGRARLGGALSTLAFVALGIDLFFRVVPSSLFEAEESPLALLVLRTEVGWRGVAWRIGALCMFLVGLGPIAAQPLPRRGGAVAGACGAVLLSALVSGLPSRLGHERTGIYVLLGLLWVVASVLVAIGLGAMARAGAKPHGWIGLGLAILGILGLLPALALFDKSDKNTYAFVMSMPFGLLGVGVGLLGWRGAPLETARKVLGGMFVAAFVGGTFAWIATYLELLRVVRSREPWSLAYLTTEPIATYGLVLWAALLLYLATPPGAAGVAQERPPMPAPPPAPGWGQQAPPTGAPPQAWR